VLFEFDKYERDLHQVPPAFPGLPYQAVENIQSMSLLYWAEHCVECAAPSCYQTCDLYRPRTDSRCRRFTFGAYKNRNFRTPRGSGVEVSFKKWAKMSAYANLRLLPPGYVSLGEKLVEWIAPAANVFGKFMARVTKRPRWKTVTHVGMEELVRRLDRTRRKEVLPDAFLLEVYNPANKEIRMQLSFSSFSEENQSENALTQLWVGFASTVHCSPGYTRHQIDLALLGRLLESGKPFIVSITPEADENSRLVFLSGEFVKFTQRPETTDAKSVKCVVFDLDHTLWKGVLVEGDEVAVPAAVVDLLKHLDQRGILLSIASRNDYQTAWKKLEELRLNEYFVYPQINWNPKSQSVQTIAKHLNIGADSMAFIDDNPFELDEVARAMPEVLCIHAKEMASLFSDRRFQGSGTPDAARRRQLYQEAAVRESAQDSFGTDYRSFLASCEIVLEVEHYSHEDAERVAELVQRTNQLNFSGRKYTRQELQAILSNPLLDKYVLKSKDRYGSYGTVGFCIVGRAPNMICVRDLMLSCRVQGKLLEAAFFRHLLEHHNPESAKALWVNFHPTERNKPAQQVLESLGFLQSEVRWNGFSHGMLRSACEPLECDLIQVSCSSQAPMAVSTSTDIEGNTLTQ